MALRICGSGALRWFLASGLVLACTSSMAQDAKEAVAVEAAKVVAAPLSEQVTAIGTLLSDEAVTVSSEIPGRLKEIHFQEGQPVAKGAPLFTLDESVYRAQLADAEAKLKLAEQTHQRASSTVAVFTARLDVASSTDWAVAYLFLKSWLARWWVCSASLSFASASASWAR